MKARRIYYLVMGLLSVGLLFPGGILLLVGVWQAVEPRPNRWRKWLLLSVFGTFALLSVIKLLAFRNLYFLAFAVLYFLLASRRIFRFPTFYATWCGMIGLTLASTGMAYGGITGLILAALATAAVAFFLYRSKALRQCFHWPEDVFVHYFLICAFFLTWFFMFPSPAPPQWTARLTGVEAIATYPDNSTFRSHFFMRQIQMLDEFDESRYIVTSKRRLPFGTLEHDAFLIDKETLRVSPDASGQTISTTRVVHCPAGGPLRFYRPMRSWRWAPWMFFVEARQSGGAELNAYCLEHSDSLAVGYFYWLKIFDSRSDALLYEDRPTSYFPQGPFRQTAPYRDGQLVYLRNNRLLILARPAGAERIEVVSDNPFPHDLIGDGCLLGREGGREVIMALSNGEVARVDPLHARIVATARIKPGLRFAVLEPQLNLLILVNDLLGRLDILDARTLKNLDHFSIGHAARNFNLLPGRPGVGVIASSTGLWKIDLCTRLPQVCENASAGDAEGALP